MSINPDSHQSARTALDAFQNSQREMSEHTARDAQLRQSVLTARDVVANVRREMEARAARDAELRQGHTARSAHENVMRRIAEHEARDAELRRSVSTARDVARKFKCEADAARQAQQLWQATQPGQVVENVMREADVRAEQLCQAMQPARDPVREVIEREAKLRSELLRPPHHEQSDCSEIVLQQRRLTLMMKR